MHESLEKISKYNVWDEKEFNAGYVRKNYLKNILKFQGNKLIKVIVGQRRAGKSYILRQIIQYLRKEKQIKGKNIFYLNKEYLAFEAIKTAKDLENLFELYRKELKVKGKVYIFLDEIQNIENWEIFVNSYSQDFTSECELFISGSNSNLLSGELASYLSGRYVEFEIFPFDFFEYADIKNLDINKQSFIRYLEDGGLPELINFEQDELKQHYVSSLRNTIILRDIISRHKVKDVDFLERIFQFLCSNIGSLTSFTSIVKYFKNQQKKTNYETVSNYVNYLCDTFIIHEVERYRLKGKQTLGGERKYYLNDLAFKNYLFGFYPDDIASHLENFVYLQLVRKQYKVSVAVSGQKEIDFIAQKADKTIYVQVAYLLNEQKTVEREFGNLLEIKDNFEKIVVSLDEIQFSDYQGIKQLKPWQLDALL